MIEGGLAVLLSRIGVSCAAVLEHAPVIKEVWRIRAA